MQEIMRDDSAATEWERTRPLIDEALHTLSATDREAVLLRFFQGRPFAEIGAALRLTEEAARKRVERALEKLPPHQRVPLVLYHFEDMPYEDIARKTGVSLSKVKTDILRGREALAKVLMRSGATHEKFGN